MNSIAISVSRLRLTSRSGWVERPLQFISLAKPRVMALSLFAASVGLMIAPRCPEPLHGFIAILAIAAGRRSRRRIQTSRRALCTARLSMIAFKLVGSLGRSGCVMASHKSVP
jgi:heme O synthase-like polyprenyltransferase